MLKFGCFDNKIARNKLVHALKMFDLVVFTKQLACKG